MFPRILSCLYPSSSLINIALYLLNMAQTLFIMINCCLVLLFTLVSLSNASPDPTTSFRAIFTVPAEADDGIATTYYQSNHELIEIVRRSLDSQYQ